MLNGTLNQSVGPYVVDVAMHVGDHVIAVEYDAWYWHAARLDEDDQRDSTLLAAGWKVLRIKSNALLPDIDRLNNAINELVAGKYRAELILDDWSSDRPSHTMNRPRRSKQARARSGGDTVRIEEKASDCIGELDRRYLYIRCSSRDLAKLRLAPAESHVFAYELRKCNHDNEAAEPKRLIFTYASVRAALAQPKRRNETTGSMMCRLRGLVEFTCDDVVGLVGCQTKGRFATTIPICRRPAERRHETVQTAAREWRPFIEARTFAIRLGLLTQHEWHQWAKTPERPSDIPSNPQRTYRGKGWTTWGNWLGKVQSKTEFVRRFLIQFPDADSKEVERAWKRESHSGDSVGNVYYQIRHQLGLTKQNQSALSRMRLSE